MSWQEEMNRGNLLGGVLGCHGLGGGVSLLPDPMAAHCHTCHVANLRNLVWNMKRKVRSFHLKALSLFSHFLSVVRKCVGVVVHSKAGLMCWVCHLGQPKVFKGERRLKSMIAVT